MASPPFTNPTFQLDRVFTITQGVNGQIGVIGNVTDEADTGFAHVQLVPDAQADATFVVVGRSQSKAAADNSPIGGQAAPWLPIPYQRVTLGNQASDYAFVSDPISMGNGPCQIIIPASGMQVGLLVSITTATAQAPSIGFVTVYPTRVVGTGSI